MPNRLNAEASPYLRQHADNPVDWYPWGPEALARARAEDRPILLSVGYAACHWCHVMAHECFEDDEVAAAMNRHFVNVKVDREERPDLDHLYQRANQMLTGRPGGWPLTVFLTPDQTPFFSGTYFPKQSRQGLIGFLDLVGRIDEVWRTRRDDLEKQNTQLRQQLDGRSGIDPGAVDGDPAALTDAALTTLLEQADRDRGGLGSAPKFPHPVEWRLLLRHGGNAARAAALQALRAMAMGGLQDQVGGGFFRYCVDDDWQIPHFEKMLYDNALLLGLYAEAHRVSPDPLWVDAAEGIVEWLEREMLVEGPAFCASLDADSAHEEGAFYVWTPEEARAVLGEAAMRIARLTFGLDGPPNFEGNAWHLRRRQDDATLAAALGLAPAEFAAERARLRTLLRAERETRVRPGLDDKQISAWNALMCTGLLRAGRLLGRPGWIALAQRALDALRRDALVDGRLRAIRQQGSARLNAYLDDHAFLLEALIESLQADYRPADLAFAEQVATAIVERFQDAEGVLWMVSNDHETLLARPRNLHDNAIPAGAAVAIGALAGLGSLAGEPRWNEAAARAFAVHLGEAAAYPAACASFWLAAAAVRGDEAVLTIRAPAASMADWRRALDAWLPPSAIVCWQPDETAAAQATLCSGRQCHPPVADPAALRALWQQRGPG
jgi:hypothetical protein